MHTSLRESVGVDSSVRCGAAQVELDAIAQHEAGSPMRVTWIGHATLLIQVCTCAWGRRNFQENILWGENDLYRVNVRVGQEKVPRT